MRYLAATALLACLGLFSGAAVAELSSAQVPTLPITTALPPVTVTLPVTTPTLPVTTPTLPVTVTTPPATVTVPPVSVTVPLVTTVTSPVRVAVPPVTVSTPVATVTTPAVGPTVPGTTTPATSTTSRPTTTASGAPSAAQPRPDAAAPVGGGGPASQGASGGGVPGAAVGEESPASPSTPSSPFSESGDGSFPEAITSLRSSRSAIVSIGPRARRSIVVRFRLDRPRRVRVGVMQVAPVCRFVGSFAIRGRAGSNALRFDRRFEGRRLPAGTYELRLRSTGVATRRLRVVISDSARLSPAALAAAKQRNVCAAPRVNVEGLATSLFGPPSFLAPGSANQGRASSERVPSEGAVLSAVYDGNNGDGFDFTSSTAGRLTEEVSQSPLGRLLIGLALLLFVIAAFPRNMVSAPVLGPLVAARRIEVAAVGASLFVGVLVVVGLA